MTLEILEDRIARAASTTSKHTNNCHALIESGALASALEYCVHEKIDPPQCSLTAKSENANRLRATAARKLSDPQWWKKCLETRAIRHYEAEQMAMGNVRNYISDGLAAYTNKQKSRK